MSDKKVNKSALAVAIVIGALLVLIVLVNFGGYDFLLSGIDDTSVGDTPVGDTSVGDTSVGDTSVGDTSVGDTPVGDALVIVCYILIAILLSYGIYLILAGKFGDTFAGLKGMKVNKSALVVTVAIAVLIALVVLENSGGYYFLPSKIENILVIVDDILLSILLSYGIYLMLTARIGDTFPGLSAENSSIRMGIFLLVLLFFTYFSFFIKEDFFRKAHFKDISEERNAIYKQRERENWRV